MFLKSVRATPNGLVGLATFLRDEYLVMWLLPLHGKPWDLMETMWDNLLVWLIIYEIICYIVRHSNFVIVQVKPKIIPKNVSWQPIIFKVTWTMWLNYHISFLIAHRLQGTLVYLTKYEKMVSIMPFQIWNFALIFTSG